MATQTDAQQRLAFYTRHLRGETYQEIADSEGVSRECVRYWCRRQRNGGNVETAYQREPMGILSRFEPKVRYCVLRLRLEHPRWGPKPILAGLKKRHSLRGLKLPSEAGIGRYLHQWPRFQRRRKQQVRSQRPNQAKCVHQRWQIDFKLGIALDDGTLVNLHTVRDPVGEACIGAFVFEAGKTGQKAEPVTMEQARSVLRSCFAHWNTLPDEIQTDGDPVLIGHPEEVFPSVFTLWLKGLGMDHLVIRSGRPTDNAEVERCHRTINDYAVIGHKDADVAQLQKILNQSVSELNFELPSRAEGCAGLPPITAHPELLQPRRPFQPEHELASFDLGLVDAYLATFTWERKVSKAGQVEVGRYRYWVGRDYARHQVLARFDPDKRHFVFYEASEPQKEIGRRPARNLDVTDLTGLAPWPVGLGLQQLPLPWPATKGVNC